jgi:hypothetical protein
MGLVITHCSSSAREPNSAQYLGRATVTVIEEHQRISRQRAAKHPTLLTSQRSPACAGPATRARRSTWHRRYRPLY